MSTPEVSVVVPAYNASAYLAEAIDSALEQDAVDHEVIVIDDGSTDSTPDVISRYGNRIRWRRQANSGVSAARNAGIRMARGELIAFLDADDVWDRKKLARQVAALQKSRDAAAVGTGMLIVDRELAALRYQPPGDPDIASLLVFSGDGGLTGGSRLMARANVLLELGGYDTRMSTSADWDIALRLLARAPATIVDAPLVLYRQHASNMHRQISAMEADMRLAFSKFFAAPNQSTRVSKRAAYAALFQVLAGSYWKAGAHWRALRCAAMAAGWEPTRVLPMVRRVRSRSSDSRET